MSNVTDEGLWDILIKDIPKEVTSYTFSMDILKQGVSYDFRIIGVNDYGYGSPSQPSPSVSGTGTADTDGEDVWMCVAYVLFDFQLIRWHHSTRSGGSWW